MANTKITKRDYFNMIIALAENADRTDLVDFCKHELELLANKKSGTKSETKAQKINKVLDERIMTVLENAESPLRASEVLALVDYSDIEGLDNVTLPKITNRLTYLCKEAKRVDRLKDKRSIVFTVGTGNGAVEKTVEETD